MILKELIIKNLKNYKFKIVKIKEIDDKFIRLLKKTKINYNEFQSSLKTIENNFVDNFIFFLRVLDFRLWEYPNNWQYKNRTEFYGLLERVKDLIKINNLNNINLYKFKKIISPKESEYLAKLRYRLFKQSLNWLNKNYQGKFENYFEKNHKQSLVFCLKLFELEKFKDYYKNFYFLKPNQLLYFEYLIAKNLLKKFEEQLEELTIFADYKIPQIFLNFNIIELPTKYIEKIKEKRMIKNFSILENELRLASIILGENLSKKLNIPSFVIDNLLWNLSHKINFKIPFHRTKTIFY